ncbi:MAG: hypothetical protein HUJ26_08955 [Planctomycetaceae bacterium]|nr:hypothetical protein [Planctomycetaceae bacterium]
MPDCSTNHIETFRKTFLQRWLGWRGVVLFFVLMLISLPFLYRGYRLGQVPVLDPPFDVEEFTRPIPDDENAYHGFEQAYGELVDVPDAEYEAYNAQLETGWDLGTDVLERHLDNNRRALKTWRETCELDQYQPHPYQTQDDGPLIPVIDSRELCRLAEIQIQKSAKLGTPKKALPWIRASLRHAYLIRQRGPINNYQVGVAYFSSSSCVINDWSSHPQLTRTELDEAIQELVTARQLNPEFSEVLKAECLANASLYELWSVELDQHVHDTIGSGEVRLGSNWRAWLEGEPAYTVRLFPHMAQNHLRFIHRDRRDRPAIIHGSVFDATASSPSKSSLLTSHELDTLISQSLISGQSWLSSGLRATDRDEARYRCLLVALAAQAYFRDHGEFPADAAELIPEYLDEIPDDLYSPTPAPLIYRRDGEGAVVYSRFENEIDDGGLEVDYSERSVSNELLELGYRIRSPLTQPLYAPK